MNRVLGPLGIAALVAGVVAAVAAVVRPGDRGALVSVAVAFLAMGGLFVWLHGLLKDLPNPGLRGGMHQLAAVSEIGAEYLRGIAEAPERAARLRREGRPGVATVLAVRRTGLEVNMTPLADVDLLVEVDGRPGVPVSVRVGLHEVAGARVEEGRRLRVLVNPADPSDLFIEGPLASTG